MRKRNKFKWFGYHLSKMLWYGNPESSLLNSYKNTWYCSSVIEVDEEGMAKAKYCKNRWCPICQRNKMGAMINQYGPRLEQEQELWFLTLTRQNVRAEALKQEKVECTYHGQQFLEDGSPDPWYDTYHPHNHLLISDKELAEFIIKKWKELNPECSEDAQNIKRVKTAGGYLEIFKYFTKLIAKDASGRRFFDAVHMDVIFRSMQGRRVYFRLGTKKAWGCEEVTEEDEDMMAVIETDALL